MRCEVCGSTENLVEHHISYIPEVKQILCRKHHQELHRTGTKYVEYKKSKHIVDVHDDWQTWESTIYTYKYKRKLKTGTVTKDRPAMIRVPINIVRDLGLSHMDDVLVSIRKLDHPTDTKYYLRTIIKGQHWTRDTPYKAISNKSKNASINIGKSTLTIPRSIVPQVLKQLEDYIGTTGGISSELTSDIVPGEVD